MTTSSKNFETLALHGGSYRADPATGAVAVPLHQTTSFQFNDTAHAGRLFALQELGNIYTRIGNPTQDVFEQRIAALEGGVAALAVASGQTATTFAILNLAQSGDNIVSSTDLYGGTVTLLAQTLKQFGIEVRFVDPSDPENFRKASDDKTRAYYAETLPNPKLHVFPIAEVAEIGRKIGIPLIVDNTAAPLIARPLEHGAAVVVHSATKYIGGHGTSIGGVIVDGGNFPWDKHAERFPTLNTPDEGYHGAIWTEAAKPLGPIAYILRIRVKLLRDIGAAISPFNAWQFIQGLETLPLRVRQQNENAAKIATFLNKHKQVKEVIFPGLQGGKQKARAKKYLKGGYGALVGFELKGGVEGGKAFIDALKLLYHVANIGDARSLAIHPASTTHQQLTSTEQLAAGVTPGYIRLSIGIEHPDDIIADITQALQVASGAKSDLRLVKAA
ncbi:O-acetylhomoserine aminocarboxypropyltransferase/cysteine synthase family protein [Aestuariivirga litoralis]|uniref:O-acetylhomoserine aminocarboxypropyltransferase/cysteine synthase family protein n=1 Tax=Aestuariivirga litoralis TaxID=2650924 RepID=UPI0018C7322E|nr:PLP-dependent transferase [Aestuariivirga litoralis]MBG1232576.1 bifunctional O-acetylhomoserine aminocarboxypropyltransferase/cysteine synthase [Aestuariivirga litoralis]